MPQQRLDMRRQLVFWYALDEASGSRYDKSKHGLTLTDTNTVTRADGPDTGSYAAQFAAASAQKLEHVDDARLHLGHSLTLAATVYLDSLPGAWADMLLVDHSAGAPGWEGYQLGLYAVSGSAWKFGVYVGDDTVAAADAVYADSLGTPSTATWYRVVGWRDYSARSLCIQVNRGTVHRVALATNHSPGTGSLRVGVAYDGASSYLDGRLCRVAGWDRALTGVERNHYMRGWNP